MGINKKLLDAFRLREIPVKDFLRIPGVLEGKSGEEKRRLQDELAEKIVREYPPCVKPVGKKRGEFAGREVGGK